MYINVQSVYGKSILSMGDTAGFSKLGADNRKAWGECCAFQCDKGDCCVATFFPCCTIWMMGKKMKEKQVEIDENCRVIPCCEKDCGGCYSCCGKDCGGCYCNSPEVAGACSLVAVLAEIPCCLWCIGHCLIQQVHDKTDAKTANPCYTFWCYPCALSEAYKVVKDRPLSIDEVTVRAQLHAKYATPDFRNKMGL